MIWSLDLQTGLQLLQTGLQLLQTSCKPVCNFCKPVCKINTEDPFLAIICANWYSIIYTLLKHGVGLASICKPVCNFCKPLANRFAKVANRFAKVANRFAKAANRFANRQKSVPLKTQRIQFFFQINYLLAWPRCVRAVRGVP